MDVSDSIGKGFSWEESFPHFEIATPHWRLGDGGDEPTPLNSHDGVVYAYRVIGGQWYQFGDGKVPHFADPVAMVERVPLDEKGDIGEVVVILDDMVKVGVPFSAIRVVSQRNPDTPRDFLIGAFVINNDLMLDFSNPRNIFLAFRDHDLSFHNQPPSRYR